jgi:hypothetical protein
LESLLTWPYGRSGVSAGWPAWRSRLVSWSARPVLLPDRADMARGVRLSADYGHCAPGHLLSFRPWMSVDEVGATPLATTCVDTPPTPMLALVISLADPVQAAPAEYFGFGEAVARDAPQLWLEAVLARKPRMPSDLEARLLQGSGPYRSTVCCTMKCVTRSVAASGTR